MAKLNLTFGATALNSVRRAMFLFSGLLVACQHAPPIPTSPVNENPNHSALVKQHAQQLQTKQTFKLESKIAIQNAGKGHSGRLLWQHDGANDALQLLSPFGQQVALITRTAQLASMRDQQQRIHTAPDVETLTQQLLGWSLPLTGLPYWAMGLPAPERTAQVQYTPLGYLHVLTQDGWQISYEDYRPTGIHANNQAVEDVVLPYRIDLQRLPNQNQGIESDLRIRFKVISWQID